LIGLTPSNDHVKQSDISGDDCRQSAEASLACGAEQIVAAMEV
jgi:hypothetical protein